MYNINGMQSLLQVMTITSNDNEISLFRHK